MILYNSIGKDYNNTRSADPKIVEKIITIFKGKSNCKIADIGAGTGNYSYELAKHGFKVYALEPSDVMYNQRKKHKKIKWIKGFAENIPFKDNYFDGVICILSSHHFTSLERFLKETVRILKINRSLLLFTADPRKIDNNCWFTEYFNSLIKKAIKTLPSQIFLKNILEKFFNSKCTIYDFKLPPDLKDGFFFSAWRYPEKYLNEEFRKGISIFSRLEDKEIEKRIKRLNIDLKNGVWDQKYGNIRKNMNFNGGYYFITIKKNLK